MAASRPIKCRAYRVLFTVIIFQFISACGPVPTVKVPPTPTSHLTPTPSLTPTVTLTETPTISPTRRPLTLVFYGDSVLKVGDVSQAPSEGFSFVDPLKQGLPPGDQVIVSNHGGRRARWAYENIDTNVLQFQPDLVTLWWGMNDLGGCPGVFDRDTNALLPNQLSAMINDHIYYLRMQVEAVLAEDIPVFVMTPIPVMGQLPWSHFTADNQLVWEDDHHCDFNIALEELVAAQRMLIEDYALENKPVYLVDAWQVYKDNPNAGKMYMDVVHPASHGAELIAAEWLRVFVSIDFH